MRYVSVEQLAERYGVDRSTVWRWSKRGLLPPPVKLSEQCTRWDLEKVVQRERERDEQRGAVA